MCMLRILLAHRGRNEVDEGQPHDLVDVPAEGGPDHAVAHAHHEHEGQGKRSLGRAEEYGEGLSPRGPRALDVPVSALSAPDAETQNKKTKKTETETGEKKSDEKKYIYLLRWTIVNRELRFRQKNYRFPYFK